MRRPSLTARVARGLDVIAAEIEPPAFDLFYLVTGCYDEQAATPEEWRRFHDTVAAIEWAKRAATWHKEKGTE